MFHVCIKDIAIVGYPKVGNTWFQMMMRAALCLFFGMELKDKYIDKAFGFFAENKKFKKSYPLFKVNIDVTHGLPNLNTKTWQEDNVDVSAFRYKRIIFLVREVKDTLVSYYMHNTHRLPVTPKNISITDFIHDQKFGINRYLQYYRQWDLDWGIPVSVYLVRYEDLMADGHRVLKEAMASVGINCTDEIISEAVRYGSFDNLRNIEKNGLSQVSAIRSPHNVNDNDSYKVRRGIVGGYKDYMDELTIRYIDSRIKNEMPKRYGY